MEKDKDKKSNNLIPLRHTTEHILQQAVKELYPQIQLAMGPATNDGFYFDFDSSPDGKEPVKISDEDLPKIEKRMQEIIDSNLPIIKEEISEKKARELFPGNPYKNEWIDEIIRKGEKITVYWTGKPGEKNSMVDLCCGPHLSSTGEVKAFKLLSVAGAYWHGDEKNKMLTRIYGTAFPSKEELEEYLFLLEESKKRDHRKIGKVLEIFMFDDEVGQGLPLYLPNGAIIRHLLMDFALNTYFRNGYVPVSTPHIGNENLWQRSGHLKFYAESMYGSIAIDEEKYRLKPMNCPFHVKMYNSKKRSYKELPIRWTEMGTVYRYEKSGELHGLTRPRGFTQDDAHLICAQDQLENEIKDALKLVQYIYKTVGMEDLIYKLSVRDPENLDKYFGDNDSWNKAEEALKKVLVEIGKGDFEVDIGGAAFYAPKIDIDAVDSMKRRWQLSTIQIDFNLPEKFDMKYTDSDGVEKRPFMIHRALLGSLERFLGVYIEHTAGNFPLWLSPEQVRILPVSDRFNEYAQSVKVKIESEFDEINLWARVKVDDRSETLQSKIRDSEIEKVPYTLIVGKREEESNSVSIRIRGIGDKGSLEISKLCNILIEKVTKRDLSLEF